MLICLLSLPLVGQIPTPQEGQRWVLNKAFSDEFNGTELDQTKWHNKHPYWVGRPPAIFMPNALTVQNGALEIKNYKLAQDSVHTFPWNGSQATYTMAGGAVVSKSDQAHYGFYEVRMKASRIRMSSTFWLKNRWVGGFADAACPNNITELDIIEAIGDWNMFATHMMSNTHYIHKECGQPETWHSEGGNSAVGAHVSDAFHTYGCYWKNPKEMDFYIDGAKKHTIYPSTAENPAPFSRPMFMNLVTETYDWVTPPTTADLNDDNRNTTFYDWVRSYYLIDVDDPLPTESLIVNGGFETGDFEGWTGWGGSPREVVSDDVHSGDYAVHIVGAGAPEQALTLKPNTTYTLSCFGKSVAGTITFGVKENDAGQAFLGGVDVTAPTYTEYSFDFTTGSEVNVKCYFFAQAGEEGYADDFTIVETNGTGGGDELVMPFDPELNYYDSPIHDPTFNLIHPKVEYKASVDRNVIIELTDDQGMVIASATELALAGFGRKVYALPLSSPIVDGETYTLTTKLVPTDDPATILAETSAQFMDFTTSIDDVNATTLKLFPNPTDQLLQIEHGQGKEFVIYDVQGRVKMEGIIPQDERLLIGDFPQGAYVFVVDGFRKVFLKN